MTTQSEMRIAQELRTKSFWLTIVGVVLTVIVALGVPLTPSQVHTLTDAAGILIALILGLSGTAMVHAHNAAKLETAATTTAGMTETTAQMARLMERIPGDPAPGSTPPVSGTPEG